MLTTIGDLGFNATAENGFDTAARFNQQFAALQGAPLGASTLFSVHGANVATPTTTGLAAAIAPLDLGTARFAQGLAVVNDNVLPPPPVPVAPEVTATATATAIATPYAVPYVVRLRAGLSATVRPRRDRRKPFRFKVAGRVKRPAGVGRKGGCAGRVQVTLKRGSKRLARRTVPVRSTCRFSASVRLNRKAGKRGTARITVRFQGNERLLPRTVTRSARYGRKKK